MATVVPDAAGRRIGGTGEGPPERPDAGRPQPQPITDAKKGGARRRADASASKGATAAADGEEGGTKKSKKKLLIIAAVVVILLAGVYMVKGRSHAVVYTAGETVPNGKVVSIGTITANTSDGHLVQAGIDLQLTVVADAKQEETDKPEFTNAAIGDLSNWSYAELLTNTGRTGLQKQLLASFQQILGPVDGAAEQVSAVYFTSFILQ